MPRIKFTRVSPSGPKSLASTSRKISRILKRLRRRETYMSENAFIKALEQLINLAEFFLTTDLQTILDLREPILNQLCIDMLLEMSLD